MRGPGGIAASPNGRIYVADSFNNRVQMYSTSGVYIGQWGSPGEGHGQFQRPIGIAVGPGDEVYVLEESGAHRVQVFTPNGAWLREWTGDNQPGGSFAVSKGIAIDDSGYVYVVGPTGRKVQKFTSVGAYVTEFGQSVITSAGSAVIDVHGNLVVADGTRVTKFTTSGVFLGYIGESSVAGAQYIATDALGGIYVTEPDNDRVTKFSADGKLVSRWGSGGEGDCAFVAISGIAVDASGDIYVADPNNPFFPHACIQRFSYAPTPVLPRTWGSIKAIYR